mmetsp:Transcript_50636/g.146940  ORF Transcript_50636/g.146940 Transcript_50636/m.146940 type:complete len:202 (+) Transcript_50636:2353-2958(+)
MLDPVLHPPMHEAHVCLREDVLLHLHLEAPLRAPGLGDDHGAVGFQVEPLDEAPAGDLLVLIHPHQALRQSVPLLNGLCLVRFEQLILRATQARARLDQSLNVLLPTVLGTTHLPQRRLAEHPHLVAVQDVAWALLPAFEVQKRVHTKAPEDLVVLEGSPVSGVLHELVRVAMAFDDLLHLLEELASGLLGLLCDLLDTLP